MSRVMIIVLATITAASVHAQELWPVRGALSLSTTDMLRRLETEPPARPEEIEKFPDRFLTHLKKQSLGVGSLLTLVPPENRELVESEPPMFAFVVRAKGRRFVTFTRPGARVDQDDRLLFQRLLVSDLFEGRRYSLTIYEDHGIAKDAARFLGVGARLALRPDVQPLGYRLRMELLTSFHPDHGATGYFSLSARLPPPKPVLAVPLPLP